jgi:hypothetical protein
MDSNMRKSFFLVFAIVALLVISSTITRASATPTWIKSEILPPVPYTASNPGSTKICGDHKCGPFEEVHKSLQDMLKQNRTKLK